MSPQLTTFEQLEARVVELERLSVLLSTDAFLILATFIKECAATPMDKLKATHALLAIQCECATNRIAYVPRVEQDG